MHFTMPQGKHVQTPDSPDPQLMMEIYLYNQMAEHRQKQTQGTKGVLKKQFFIDIEKT